MPTVRAATRARKSSASAAARLVCQGVGTLELPWWPSEEEVSGLAPTFTETARVGKPPLLQRSGEPMATRRLVFTVRGDTLATPATPWLAMVERLAVARPVVRLLMGATDRATWVITEAGYTPSEWTETGEIAAAEVTLTMRRTDAAIAIGPITKKKSKKKKKSAKKTTTTKTKAKTRTKPDGGDD